MVGVCLAGSGKSQVAAGGRKEPWRWGQGQGAGGRAGGRGSRPGSACQLGQDLVDLGCFLSS